MPPGDRGSSLRNLTAPRRLVSGRIAGAVLSGDALAAQRGAIFLTVTLLHRFYFRWTGAIWKPENVNSPWRDIPESNRGTHCNTAETTLPLSSIVPCCRPPGRRESWGSIIMPLESAILKQLVNQFHCILTIDLIGTGGIHVVTQFINHHLEICSVNSCQLIFQYPNVRQIQRV